VRRLALIARPSPADPARWKLTCRPASVKTP
jgi:hypothetical protein